MTDRYEEGDYEHYSEFADRRLRHTDMNEVWVCASADLQNASFEVIERGSQHTEHLSAYHALLHASEKVQEDHRYAPLGVYLLEYGPGLCTLRYVVGTIFAYAMDRPDVFIRSDGLPGNIGALNNPRAKTVATRLEVLRAQGIVDRSRRRTVR